MYLLVGKVYIESLKYRQCKRKGSLLVPTGCSKTELISSEGVFNFNSVFSAVARLSEPPISNFWSIDKAFYIKEKFLVFSFSLNTIHHFLWRVTHSISDGHLYKDLRFWLDVILSSQHKLFQMLLSFFHKSIEIQLCF